MTMLKQYGMPRSGTNALKAILQENLHLEVLTARWGSKHACCQLQPGQRMPVVVSVKDPYAWVDSVWRYECKKSARPRKLLKFLGEPYEYRDTLRTAMRFRTPMGAWNTMNRHWLHIQGCRVLAVRAADLCSRERVVKVLDSVVAMFGRHLYPRAYRLGGPWMPEAKMSPRTSGPEDDHQPVQSNLRFDPDYYLERKYRRSYTTEAAETVTKGIDWGLANALNYQQMGAEALAEAF